MTKHDPMVGMKLGGRTAEGSQSKMGQAGCHIATPPKLDLPAYEGITMFKVPSKFLTRLRDSLDWKELRFGYENQLVDGTALIDHACRILSESGCDNDELLALASARETDELKPLIDRLAGTPQDSPEHARKWALILAAVINESDVPDKLEAIEEVYSSFDYPEELAEFVRYMPMRDPDLGSQEANENRMLEKLRAFSTKIVD